MSMKSEKVLKKTISRKCMTPKCVRLYETSFTPRRCVEYKVDISKIDFQKNAIELCQ